MIKLKNVSYTYMSGGPFEKTAVSDINLTINDGDFITVIGGTAIAVEAAEGFVTELQSGVPLRSALEDFCREILEHGDLS